jgi:hypothetical protein
MAELPVFFGAVQGPNMWGRAAELIDGRVIGMTGARRGTFEHYTPFVTDHTLGTGLDPKFPGFQFLTPSLFNEIAPYPNGFCASPPSGANCSLSRFLTDPSWSPDGRALISFNPERTYGYFGEGSSIFEHYTSGSLSTAERLEVATQYAPRSMGIALLNGSGVAETIIPNQEGYLYRYPVWVGKRQPPRIQPWKATENDPTSTLHIADFKIWMTFALANDGQNKTSLMNTLDRISAVRVLYKDTSGNACIRDTGPYWNFVHSGNTGDHPTALGIADATGYIKLHAPPAAGGNEWGDVDLKSDNSIRLKVPSGKLLLFQGIDANGHVVVQKSRLSALPSGHHSIQASVKRGQYFNQCASCHGVLAGENFPPLEDLGRLPAGLDFDTVAAQEAPADLTLPVVEKKRLTYLHSLQPIIEAKCLSCHGGENPASELSLESHYSESGNFPAGFWADPIENASYYELRNIVDPSRRRPSYSYSPSHRWIFHNDENEYRTHPEYQNAIQNDLAIGDLAPWAPGYQNLFRKHANQTHWYYLSQRAHPNAFGRSSHIGGNSSSSYLIERLTGRNLDSEKTQGRGTFVDHSRMLTEEEKRLFMSVIDVGFPYMSRCDDRPITSGPNAGASWGDTQFQKIAD